MKKLLGLLLFSTVVLAQSVPNGTIVQGQIWTPAQWNTAWQAKADISSGTLISPILSGTYSLAPVTVNSTSNINATSCTFTPSVGCQGFGWSGAISGSFSTGTYAANQFYSASDTLANTSSNPLVSVLEVDNNFGGVFQGLAQGAQVNLIMTSATANSTPGASQYSVLGLTGQLNTSDGGTGGTPKGSLYGFNPNVRILGAAQNINLLAGGEIDVAALAGSTLAHKFGLSITQVSNDAVLGSLSNSALTFANQSGAVGWNLGLSFGGYAGFWPMTASGTLIGCYAHGGTGSCGTTAIGIDFSNVTFVTDFLKSTGFTVDGSGNSTVSSITSAGTGNWTGSHTFTPSSGTAITVNVPVSGLGVSFVLPGATVANAFTVSNTTGNQAGFALLGNGLAGANAFTISQNASGQAVLGQANNAALILQTNGTNRLVVNSDGGLTTPAQTDKGAGSINAASLWVANVAVTDGAILATGTVASARLPASSVTLAGTSGSIGGGALIAGQCASGTATVTSATTSMVALADPNTYPGDGTIWDAQVTSANTVTVKVCAIIALTPTSSTYNVRVLQ